MDKRALPILALAIAGCSSPAPPADVAGTYTINLTNGENGCEVMNWTVGDTTTGVPLVITQDGSSFTATVQGLAAGYLDLTVGDHVFTGTVTGSHLDGLLRGDARTTGGCAYSIDVALDADLSGDALSGELVWFPNTNDSPDCTFAGCTNRQALNGIRPPSAD